MKQTLYLVSGNQGKIDEATAILEFPIEIKKIDLDEIQDSDITRVVTHKVQQAYEIVKKPVIVDDVGFDVEVWGGFPGPFVKYIRPNNSNELLLYMMRNETNRKVKAVSAVGFCDGDKTEIFIGEVNGTLTREERGENGWGFDTVVMPENSERTFAQMTDEEKNALSHRRVSLEKLKIFLNEYYS